MMFNPIVKIALLGLWLSSLWSLSALGQESPSPKIIKSHAISMYGELKYPADFKHFDYVSPKALKGGVLRQMALGTFDSLNPFIAKGNAAVGMGLIYDTLTTSSADEPFSQYGLLAESIEYPEDRAWIIFNLNAKAKFHDGHAVTADDVVFSFNTLIEKGAPFYGNYYADVAKVEALDSLRAKFTFKSNKNKELPLIIGQLAILPKHYWQDKTFEQGNLENPLGSGPYKVGHLEAGRTITFERVKDYWGKDVPSQVGMYNFDSMIYDYYRDETVALEALKSNQYDVRVERSANQWASGYEAPAVQQGLLIKREIRDYSPQGMQAFILNLRRPPFDNQYFRQALNYAFDFEWTNRNIFHGSYTRTDSYFSNSELASSGMPSLKELEILKPFKDQLPDSVFTTAFKNPITDGTGNNRDNLRKAQQLLKQAGFTLQNGQLMDPNTGKPVVIEYLERDPQFERISNPYSQNLKRLGIELVNRTVDMSQYINRMRSFDFDMTVLGFGQSLSPGNEQREFWTSAAADQNDSRNYAGIKNPVVDKLVEQIINAHDRSDLMEHVKALDRVLLHNHYTVPMYHYLNHRVAYWDKFGYPEVSPKYDPAFGVGLMTWWVDPDKEKQLKQKMSSANKAAQ